MPPLRQRCHEPSSCPWNEPPVRPAAKLIEPFYDLYSFRILPWLGDVVARDAASYRYLAESIRMHPDQEALRGLMEDAGFDDVRYHNLSGGIVALHIGFRY